MRKLFILLALVGGVIAGAAQLGFGAWPAAASGPALYLISSQGEMVTTTQVSVEIWVRNADNLAAWEVEIEYDATRLQLLDLELSPQFAADEMSCRPDRQRCGLMLGPIMTGLNGPGRALVGAATYGTGPTVSGTAQLATLHFRRVGPGGEAALTLHTPLAADPDANPTVPGVEGLTLALSAKPTNDLYLPAVGR